MARLERNDETKRIELKGACPGETLFIIDAKTPEVTICIRAGECAVFTKPDGGFEVHDLQQGFGKLMADHTIEEDSAPTFVLIVERSGLQDLVDAGVRMGGVTLFSAVAGDKPGSVDKLRARQREVQNNLIRSVQAGVIELETRDVVLQALKDGRLKPTNPGGLASSAMFAGEVPTSLVDLAACRALQKIDTHEQLKSSDVVDEVLNKIPQETRWVLNRPGKTKEIYVPYGHALLQIMPWGQLLVSNDIEGPYLYTVQRTQMPWTAPLAPVLALLEPVLVEKIKAIGETIKTPPGEKPLVVVEPFQASGYYAIDRIGMGRPGQ